MDFGFSDFDSTNFGDFEVELEDMEVKKTKKFDRMWRVVGGGSIAGCPAVKDGIAYFGSLDSYVYAVDAKTGKMLWKTKANKAIMDSSPLIDGDVLYIASADNRLYSINMHTGEIVWFVETNGEISLTPFFDENNVYVGSRDGYVYAVKKHEGIISWKFRTGDEVVSCPVVYKGRVFIGSFDGYLYCLDSETGREIWRFKTGGEIFNTWPFLVRENTIYVPSFDNYLYAIEISSGKEIWRFKTGKYGNGAASVWHNGVIYHACRDGILYALTPEGKERWRFDGAIGSPIDKRVLIHNDTIYFGSSDGNLYAVDLEGKEIWRFKVGGEIMSQPVLWENLIIFGSWDCHLYALNIDTREEAWRFTTSTIIQTQIPHAFECFKMEVTKDSGIEDAISEEKYKSKNEHSVSLSSYKIETEYSTKSDYKTKSDYDVNMIMFEGIMGGDELWISGSESLIPQTSGISTWTLRK